MFIKSMSVLALSSLALSACGSEPSSRADRDPAGASSAAGAQEADAPTPRLAVTYDGGVLVLDARTGEVLLDEPVEGFARLNPAGDDRHLFVSAGGFIALDLGAWTDDHGDHGHSWEADPRLTDFVVPAEEPGHVVPHDGRTTLFDDGTGRITAFDPADLAELDEGEPEVETWDVEPHHGVAVQDGHGNLTVSVGDHDSRSGIEVTTAAGNELAASDECPGVHGEAFAGDTAVFGCEDGALVVEGTRIRKVTAPDDYGRIGNQAGHEESPYVLGDYKVDAEAELERPTRVSVIDTRDASLRLVDLPASYSFRSLGRTPGGDGLVLGTDGRLHVIDLQRARVSDSVAVTKRWREPFDWQQPRPTLQVIGENAYVTEPARKAIHVVDLRTLQVVDTLELPQTPNELSGTAG